MIARIWRGITLASMADDYIEYLKKIKIPVYHAADGNQGTLILKEIRGEMAHIHLLSFWESDEALIKFAGPDIEIVKNSPEERKFLIAFQSTVTHYQIMYGMESNI